MKVLIGWVFILAGIIALASGIGPVGEIIFKTMPFLEQLQKNYLLIGGGVLVLIGAFLIKGQKKFKKVKGNLLPIFENKKIVGYRRN